jgi:hypothetical protein
MKRVSHQFSRRTFLKAGTVVTGGMALGTFIWPAFGEAQGNSSPMAVADLPKGAAPKPVSFAHFPSRLHAFVWRIWPLARPERMAKVVGATKKDIVRLGRLMGLGNPPRITHDQQARSYITVIPRRISKSFRKRWRVARQMKRYGAWPEADERTLRRGV